MTLGTNLRSEEGMGEARESPEENGAKPKELTVLLLLLAHNLHHLGGDLVLLAANVKRHGAALRSIEGKLVSASHGAHSVGPHLQASLQRLRIGVGHLLKVLQHV